MLRGRSRAGDGQYRGGQLQRAHSGASHLGGGIRGVLGGPADRDRGTPSDERFGGHLYTGPPTKEEV